MVSGTCFFSCRGLEQRHSRLWARRVKTTQETITFADKRKSLLVIQIQEALWRKLNNLKPYLAATKGVNFGSEGQSCRPETKPTENQYAYPEALCLLVLFNISFKILAFIRVKIKENRQHLKANNCVMRRFFSL